MLLFQTLSAGKIGQPGACGSTVSMDGAGGVAVGAGVALPVAAETAADACGFAVCADTAVDADAWRATFMADGRGAGLPSPADAAPHPASVATAAAPSTNRRDRRADNNDLADC